MSNKQVVDARTRLDRGLDLIEALIKGLKFQEAEPHLSEAEEVFEKLSILLNPLNEIRRNILENRRTRLDRLAHQIEEGLQRRQAGKREDGNLAFKCAWNDHGYRGVCSESAYTYNKARNTPWCAATDCRKYVNIEPIPTDCCYESRALLDCYFAAGWDQDGARLIRPRKILSARLGKVGLLTTQPPWTQERLVVGAFNICRVVDDPDRETEVFGDKDSLLDDMLDYQINFWKFHRNPQRQNSTAWATGLFRYVSDVAVLGMLEEYMSKKSERAGDVTRAERLVQAMKLNREREP